jgi:hypothetical protein
MMRCVTCQGRTFVTTNDVADAISNFFRAAQRRGRVVRIDVPIVAGAGCDGDSAPGESVLSLVLSPGEQLHVAESDHPDVELDTIPLIESLTRRQRPWIARTAPEDEAGGPAH